MKYGFMPNDNGRQILNIGDKVIYRDIECVVCFKHKDGFINLQQPNKNYFLGVHPNSCEKIK